MRSSSNHRLLFLAAAVLLLAPVLGVQASQPACPGLSIAPPEFLTVQSDNVVTFTVTSPVAQRLPVSFSLASEDGQVTAALPSYEIEAGPAGASSSVTIPPARLAPFAIGETLVLTGRVGVWTETVDVPLTADTPVPESGGWVLNGPATAMFYTTQDSAVTYRITNPKNKDKNCKIELKFRKHNGTVVKKWKYPTVAPAGQSTATTVIVPTAIAQQARAKNAVSVKAVLLVGGEVRTKEIALADWDLLATASADKVSGPGPLTVNFIGSASGGTPVYSYAWNFGDGTPLSTDQTTSHTYASSGFYQAVLTVVDSKAGVAQATPILITVQ